MAADAPHPAFQGYHAEPVPQAGVGAPGKDGRLELVFAAGSGGTDLVRDHATVPFHVSGTLDHDPHPDAATVFVQAPTGGVAQGDRHDVTVEVRGGAVAHVSTQSATKVQSMDHNYAAEEGRLRVGEAAHLDYVPEPTILHAGARYYRDQTVELEAGATAVLADVVVPGRLARGERFEFDRYLSRLRVRGPDGLLFEDATDLGPDADPDAPGALDGFDVYGTLFAVAPGGVPEGLSDGLHRAVTGREAPAGATALPNGAGVAVRALGDRAETVSGALSAAWDRARRAFVGAPAPQGRKY